MGLDIYEWTVLSNNGKLCIGGLKSYKHPVREHFDFVLNCAYELAPEGEEGLDSDGIHHIRLDDSPDVGSQVDEIFKGVDLLKDALRSGKKCLVTCAMGMNRSAVVIAEALIQLGVPADKVIRRIQERRRHALHNRAFVAWLCRPRRAQRQA